MPRLLPFRPLVILFLLFLPSFGRPFDWQYNNISVPFAVFYNPALLGNNPGSTFGVDMKYVDSADCDIRGAVVVPVSRVFKHEDHALMNDSRNRYFKYPNTSYKSSKTAVSIGGIYDSEGRRRMSAGLVAPVYFVQTGASFDMTYMDDSPEPALSLNAGFAANIPSVVRGGGLFYLALQNIATGDVKNADRFKLSVGTGGTSSSRPETYIIPYDFFFRFHFSDGGIHTTEGVARVGIDFSPMNTSAGTVGQTAAATLGYNFIRERGRGMEHKFFVNAGIVFMNRKSAAALLGSYGTGDEKYGTFMYSSIKKETDQTDNDIYAGLTHKHGDNGGIIFGLRSSGTTIRSWVLKIEDPSGASVKTYSGGNAVPSSIVWDGLNPDGTEVKDEILYAKLVLKGDSRVVETKMITVELKR